MTMEGMFWILIVVLSYVAAAYVAVKVSNEKLGARSNLFGIGLATMAAGFFWNQILLLRNDYIWGYYFRLNDGLHLALSIGTWLTGIGGIIMVAVDLLKAINELGSWTVKKDLKQMQLEQRSDD